MGSEGAEDPLDRAWRSAIWKEPVEGRVWAGRAGLNGDAQVDRRSHGGPERALLGYAAAHYPLWQEEWGGGRLPAGAFGENLLIEGLDESTVCVGDVFRAGDVRVEVSGPREPCMNLVRRHRRPGLIERVLENHRSGWYMRVLAEGWLEAGVPIVLLDRPDPQWPIVRAAEVKRAATREPAEARLLGACPALVADWRERLGER
jgi:MOSC domain-containing protein YiiM